MPRRGHIDGVVFKDDQGQGMYTPGLPLLAGVEVILDNVRYTRTDSSGRFRFDDVPYGRHRVEARYASSQPTFFTTPSPAEVDTGASVQFGIALSRSSLRGVVLTDAGAALVRRRSSTSPAPIAGPRSARRTMARSSRKDCWPGDYDVSIEAGSVPAGYPVDDARASARSRRADGRRAAPGSCCGRTAASPAGRGSSIARPASTSRWPAPPWSFCRCGGSP